ncbi:type II CAAX endopeptidase family protein [Puia sp.]|uniref:CPBP family intramembrane glutamic endopeptidase n=1 Tax=Puia sp. TaxID=2045100 RepID=UPI002F3E578F
MSDQAIKNPVLRQGWLRVLVFCVSFCVLSILIAVPAVITVAGVSVDDLKAKPIATLSGLLTGNYLWLMVLLEFAIAMVSVGIFRLLIDRRSLGTLGWGLEAVPGEGVTGLFMGPALLGVTALLMMASGHLEWVDISFDPSSLFVSLGLMALIAFSEEMVFRGYILNNLLESFPNKWVALLISGVLFAGFHFTNPGIHTLAFANLFLAGLLLGVNYIYTRNLWFSFLFHLSWNFFQGPILGFRVSGLSLPTLLVAEPKGDLFITGGDFGLEGSILNTTVSVLALCVLALFFEKKYAARSQQLTA